MYFKKILLFLTLCQLSFVYAQSDTTIYSLNGFEDIEGNSHLVYNEKYSSFQLNSDSTFYLYHFYDTKNNSEKLFNEGFDIIYYPENFVQSKLISDIEFFNNDPNKYIYSINSVDIDLDCSISRYDSANTFGGLGYIKDIYISPNDSNIIYVLFSGFLIRSSDAGLTWVEFSKLSPNDSTVQYLTFSPYDEAIIFGVNSSQDLVKSLDTGKTFFEVTNLDDWNEGTELYFDKDREHIYAVINSYEYSEEYSNITSLLYVSDNNGDPYSWKLAVIRYNHMSLCIDDSVSGSMYMSVGNDIYESKDYGNSFTPFSALPHHAVGLYKKPNENILFAAISNGIINVAPDTVTYLLSKSISNSLKLFPLELGNKWIYNESGTSYDNTAPNSFSIDFSQEITSDTILNNGQHYYYLETKPYGSSYWLYVDSLTGAIYQRYSLNDEQEYLFINLAALSGDEFETSEGIINDVIESDTLLWDQKRYSKIFRLQSLFTYEKTLAQGIGIIQKQNSFDFGYSTTILKGCIINGIVYGDTTLVDVEKVDLDLPSEFSLSQNYPNPFNPSTTIKYTLPFVEPAYRQGRRKSSFAQTTDGLNKSQSGDWLYNVTLKVYDILGREVAALVNKEQKPGNYEIHFDASELTSGIYFYRLQYGSFTQSRKMILLR